MSVYVGGGMGTGQNLVFSGCAKRKNTETSTGRCVAWDRCSLLVLKNSRFSLRGML